MVNLQDGYDENFDFEDTKDENTINAILNDQQESKYNILKNFLIILVIIAAGIGVFWGSFMLGKKVFTVSLPQPPANEQTAKAEDDANGYDVPDEKVLYEIDKLDNADSANAASAQAANVTPAPQTTEEKPQVNQEPTKETAPAVNLPVVNNPQPAPAAAEAPKPQVRTVVKAAPVKEAPKPVVAPRPVTVSKVAAVPKVVSTQKVVTVPKVKPVVRPVSKPVVQVKPAPAPARIAAIPVVKEVVSSTAPAKKVFKVIAGSYSKVENAKILEKKLKEQGFEVYLSNVNINGVSMWRVQIGAYDRVDQAKNQIIKAKALGNDAFYIQE